MDSELDFQSTSFYTGTYVILGITLLIALYNQVWTIRHTIAFGKKNVFNTFLIICSAFFLIHVLSYLVSLILIQQRDQGLLDRQKAQSIMMIFQFMVRLSWYGSSGVYLVLVLLRFRVLARQLKTRATLSNVLIGMTLLLAVPIGGALSILLMINPFFSPSMVGLLDRIWDVYFVFIDLFLGCWTIKYILSNSISMSQHSSKLSGMTSHSKNNHQQLVLMDRLLRNVTLWIVCALSWLSVVCMSLVPWGNTDKHQKQVVILLSIISLLPSALQFMFAFFWLDNVKNIVSIIRKK